MKRNILILIVLLLNLLLLFQNCKSDIQEKNQTKSISTVKKSETIVIEKKAVNSTNYSIEVEVIDSTKYNSIKRKSELLEKNCKKITNIYEVKKILNGIVEFDENKDFGENPSVKKIFFRNGKKYQNNNEFGDFFFIAYYPEEDILLCEGGHTTDVSFNLKNGKETEETGNPDLISTSPKKEFRLNGHFDGQECYSYFIQRKIADEYLKIIQLDEEFEKITKVWLCTIGESFWFDEKTLFLTETDYEEKGIAKKYFKINIIEK